MAKPKTPFFSLGATGTVAKTITTQRRGAGTMVRRTPTPTDPYTLAQAYQRWDYQHYIYLWTQLTEAQKQVWQSAACRHHMTGLAYFMKNRLTHLTNLLGRWHLDEIGGNIAFDSSRNSNHGTVFGALPVLGVIGRARFFDGLDDYINVPHNPSLKLSGKDWTIMTFIQKATVDRRCDAFQKTDRLIFTAHNTAVNNRLYLAFRQNFAPWTYHTAWSWDDAITDTLRHHIAVTYDGLTAIFYVDGIYHGQRNINVTMLDDTTAPVRISTPSDTHHGMIDEVELFDTVLDATLIKQHAERSYDLSCITE